jgi:hypothetical protein
MLRRNLALCLSLIIFSYSVIAEDLDHIVSGDSATPDELGSSTESGASPYIINGESANNVENSKSSGDDYLFNHGVKEVNQNISTKKQLEDFGYTPPGAFENRENYLEVDKIKLAKDYRNFSSGSMNITFIKNSFDYQSQDDIINRTIGSGYKSIKGGALFFRHDSIMSRRELLNTYWSLGAGVSYSSGKGIFKVDGTRSDTTFNFWEVPVDLAFGAEIPLSSWFKIAATGGPSVQGILQNRSDYQRGEKNKRKFQVSPGYFVNGQLKFNLANIGSNTSYELFTQSEITNLFMNLEVRHQSYENFQDDISITGTSFGVGFTFEYL